MISTRGKFTQQFEDRIAKLKTMLDTRHFDMIPKLAFIFHPERQADAHKKILLAVVQYIEQAEKMTFSSLRTKYKARSKEIAAILQILETTTTPIELFQQLRTVKMAEQTELHWRVTEALRVAQMNYWGHHRAVTEKLKPFRDHQTNTVSLPTKPTASQVVSLFYTKFYEALHPEDTKEKIPFSPLKNTVFEACLRFLAVLFSDHREKNIIIYKDLLNKILVSRFLSDEEFVTTVKDMLQETDQVELVVELQVIFDQEKIKLEKRRLDAVDHCRVSIGLLSSVTCLASPPAGLALVCLGGIVSLTDRFKRAVSEVIEYYDTTRVTVRTEKGWQCPVVVTSHHLFKPVPLSQENVGRQADLDDRPVRSYAEMKRVVLW